MNKLFRISVIISAFSYALFIGGWYLFTPYLSEKELDVLSWTGYGAIIEYPPIVTYALTAIWLPITIGMYFYNSKARLLYLIFTVYFIITTPLYGMFVSASFSLVFLEISNFLDGAILTMAYLTGVSQKFKNA